MASPDELPGLEQIERLRKFLERKVEEHVAHPSGGWKQRSAEWVANRKDIVGGSELATLLGKNPFSNWEKLLAKKLGIDLWDRGGVARYWGTMFEPTSERLVELECGTKVSGTSIYMLNESIFTDHGNSPDGFCVLALEFDEEGEPHICPDVQAALETQRPVTMFPVLIELKAPYRRLPSTSMPPQYKPQVWSGLSFSPMAGLALFVDVVYRICTLAQLGPSSEYSTNYHDKDAAKFRRAKREPWKSHEGWGVYAVYAPKLGTRAVRSRNRQDRFPKVMAGTPVNLEELGGSSPELDCFHILCRALGMQLGGDDLGSEVLDLGELADTDSNQFDKVLTMIEKKAVIVHRTDPVLASGRGASESELWEFIRSASEAAPEHHYLFGFLPWKVTQIDYHLVLPKEDFVEEVQPLVTEFMADVRALRMEENVPAAFQIYCARRSGGVAKKRTNVSQEDTQKLFAMVADI